MRKKWDKLVRIVFHNVKNKDFEHAVNILTDYYNLMNSESCIKWYSDFHKKDNTKEFKLYIERYDKDKWWFQDNLHATITEKDGKVNIDFYDWLNKKGFYYKLESIKLGLL